LISNDPTEFVVAFIGYTLHHGFMRPRKDLTTRKFGKLTPLRSEVFRSKDGKTKYTAWWCKCDCGNEKWIRYSGLIEGGSSSCGCYARDMKRWNETHGHSHSGKNGGPSPTMISWLSMMDRCYEPKTNRYENYGGAGVTVCKRWNKFENFIEDMGIRPEGKTLNRIDGSKNYCKDNCKWSTKTEQNRNKKTNVKITARGETLCISEWMERGSVGRESIMGRLRKGWPAEKALFHPGNRNQFSQK
jgi:hypothetical protein